MIYRSWFCLNRYCQHEFTMADADHPPCPRCGGLHVRWVPRPVAIRSEATKRADATVKELQALNPGVNYRSPLRGERMQPKAGPTPVPGRSRKWAAPGIAGWQIDLPETPNGQLYDGAVCAPAGITAKLSAPLNTVQGRHKWAASPTGATPRYEARHNPPAGSGGA